MPRLGLRLATCASIRAGTLLAIICLEGPTRGEPPQPTLRSVKGLQLKVSSNGRHFVDQHGKPFFYLSGKRVMARWFDPRDGSWREIGAYANTGTREFVPPSQGGKSDWVLVVDDTEKRLATE